MILTIPWPLAIYLIAGLLFMLSSLYGKAKDKFLEKLDEPMIQVLPPWLIYTIASIAVLIGVVFWLPMLVYEIVKAVRGEE